MNDRIVEDATGRWAGTPDAWDRVVIAAQDEDVRDRIEDVVRAGRALGVGSVVMTLPERTRSALVAGGAPVDTYASQVLMAERGW